MKTLALRAVLALALAATAAVAEDSLCYVPGCECNPAAAAGDLTDVVCKCVENQKIQVGIPSPTSPGAKTPPENAASLSFSGCGEVSLRPRLLNSLPRLRSINVTKTARMEVAPRIYDSRAKGNGESAELESIEVSQVDEFAVSRNSFEGVSVASSFMIKEVTVPRVPSLAFNFDHIKEFSIFGSRFDRVSMWGFKLASCGEFNALGMTRFFSMASQSFSMKCDKFMAAYNVFGQLQDSAFDVEFGLADIQGNTFETLTGKPFLDLRPRPTEPSSEVPSTVQSGFVFRENKFAADPTLPFGSLAMPAFEKVDANEESYVDIEDNRFVCECDKLAWFIGAATHNFDRDSLKEIGSEKRGHGSLDFIDELYDTAGKCLKCGLRSCEVVEDENFGDFADSALTVHKGQLKCSASGRPLESQRGNGSGINAIGGGNADKPSSYNYEKDDGSVDSYHNRRDGNDDNPAVGDAALASSGSSLPRSSSVYGLIVSTIATSLLAASLA